MVQVPGSWARQMLSKANYAHLARLRGLPPPSLERCPQPLIQCLSLLLLNEFHPRSMHFPPRDDDDEILAPAHDDQTKARPTDSLASSGESTMFNWSEPALRSDRMCWSLIGTSYVLAYELGIFGTYSEGALAASGRRVMRHGGSPDFNRRADRIERLLYVFIIQAAGRFGLPSMYGADVNRFASANFEDSSLLGALEGTLILGKTLTL